MYRLAMSSFRPSHFSSELLRTNSSAVTQQVDPRDPYTMCNSLRLELQTEAWLLTPSPDFSHSLLCYFWSGSSGTGKETEISLKGMVEGAEKTPDQNISRKGWALKIDQFLVPQIYYKTKLFPNHRQSFFTTFNITTHQHGQSFLHWV